MGSDAGGGADTPSRGFGICQGVGSHRLRHAFRALAPVCRSGLALPPVPFGAFAGNPSATKRPFSLRRCREKGLFVSCRMRGRDARAPFAPRPSTIGRYSALTRVISKVRSLPASSWFMSKVTTPSSMDFTNTGKGWPPGPIM